jgi:nucleotide-binding universal stress UspA family protein
MRTVSRIIVGIDGSPHSQRALEWAVHEAAVRKVPLSVITVYKTVIGYWGGAVVFPEDPALADKARAAAQEATDKALALAGEFRPANVTVEAVCGIPAEELIRASKDADMIVVGSRGTGGFSRLLLGSVGTQLTHHAHCPVVVIPAEDRR